MAVYFNIIIPFQKFIAELENTFNKYSVCLYAEKWNEKREFYYELIDIKNENLPFIFDDDYRGFFFSSKAVEIKNGNLILGKSTKKDKVSFYDHELFDFCIEGQGGRENNDNIEIIKLRIISKTPDKQIEKFYNSLQTIFKKSEEINKGLLINKYLDDKIYYYKTDKYMLSDFGNKENRYLEQD